MNPSVAVTYQLDKNADGEVTSPTKSAEPKGKKGWFLIKYADFCFGNEGKEKIYSRSWAEVKKRVLEKAKISSDAY